jgi:hypothetical protein
MIPFTLLGLFGDGKQINQWLPEVRAGGKGLV